MFWNKKSRAPTVVIRLATASALLCALFCAGLFSLVYFRVRTNLTRQADRMIADELREFYAIYQGEGLSGLRAEFARETAATGAAKLFCQLLSPQGDALLSTPAEEWTHLQAELSRAKWSVEEEFSFATLYPQDPKRVARLGALRAPDGTRLLFGVNRSSEARSFLRTRKMLLAASAAMVLLSTLAAWLIARQAMAGVRRVSRTVESIRTTTLSRRVPEGCEGQEINELAAAFNGMLQRIEQLVKELNEVSDNIAHDLRSPITRMRGTVETTLTGPQDIEAYRDMGGAVLEECDRLTVLINTMLEIARTEAGGTELSLEPTDVAELLCTAADLFLPAAEQKGVVLHMAAPVAPLWVSGDRARLQRVIANLLDNAIKYTPEGGRIDLSCRAESGAVQIAFRDNGIGIAGEELCRIFDRFYRGEKSRSTPGNGLGLSLARAIVQAHGGTLEVQSTPGQGSVFTVRLPQARPLHGTTAFRAGF
jgi:heavy metal sensor kinase